MLSWTASYSRATSVFGSSPPYMQELARILRTIREAGFYARWYDLYIRAAASSTAQGRQRMISRTELIVEPDPPKELGMGDGKVLNVFVLWTVCAGAGIVAILFERY